MPTLPINAKQATVLGAALATVAIGIAVIATRGDSVQEHARATSTAILDAGMTRDELTDLLTDPVKPGDVVTTEVNVELGKRVDMEVIYFGEARGKFETIRVDHIDHDAIQPDPGATTIRLTARNVSSEEVRLHAFVHFARPE